MFTSSYTPWYMTIIPKHSEGSTGLHGGNKEGNGKKKKLTT